MNLPNTYPEILVRSNTCFFLTLNESGEILYANEYFSKFFTTGNSSFLLNCVDKQFTTSINAAISKVYKTPGEIVSENAIFTDINGREVSTRWDFTVPSEAINLREVHAVGTFCTSPPCLADPGLSDGMTYPDNELSYEFLENISDGFFSIDNNFKVLFWNQKAEEMFGIKRGQIIGKSLHDLYTEAYPDTFYKQFQLAFEQKEVVRFQEHFHPLHTWFEISAYPTGGRLSVFTVDITEQKRSVEELRVMNERLEVVEKATKDVIWDWDLKTNKVIWNENVMSMFGFSKDDVNAKGWWVNNIHPHDRDRVKSNLKKHIREHLVNWQNEYRFRCSNGAYKYVFDRAFAIYDKSDRPVRMIGTMQDLTERKASEFILKKLNNSLEKRAIELAASNDELERFAYVTSHDLQEPLRMVTSFLQLLQKRYKEKLDAKAHEYIGFAVDGAERMKGLILDLLEYSRVNTNKGAMEVVNMNDVAGQILLTYKQSLIETEGEINIQNLPYVKGNRTQLSQLLQNLVGNALKYRSTAPPKIDIVFKEHPTEFEFEVKDNGIGIEPRFYNKIFVIFQRLHHKNEYSGTGIGLAICKKIIEKHGGRIWLESEPGHGSTFYFTLPK